MAHWGGGGQELNLNLVWEGAAWERVACPSVPHAGEAPPRVLCSVLGPSASCGMCSEWSSEAGEGSGKGDEEQLRELEQGRLRGGILAVYTCLKGGCVRRVLVLFLGDK